MTRRAKVWWAVAALYTFVNLGGAGYAAALGEGLHTAVHIGLLVLGAYVVSRVTARARRQVVPDMPRADERLEHLQQSLDAVALEVEHIGEAQRFSAKLQAERARTER